MKENNLGVNIIQFEADFQRKMLEDNGEVLASTKKYEGISVLKIATLANFCIHFERQLNKIYKIKAESTSH